MKFWARLLFIAGAATLALLAGSRPFAAVAATTSYELRLVGAEENPPVTDDAASATAVFTFDDASRTLSWSLTISGVSSDLITGAHIHRGARGGNGPIIYPLTTGGGPTTTGKVTLTDADVADLRAGNLYVNIHTAAHPGGAARAQLVLPLIRLRQTQLDALNRGDIAGTMAYFADNAVIQVGNCGPAGCSGRTAVQDEVARQISSHVHAKMLKADVSGNTLTEIEEVSMDPFLALGITVHYKFVSVFSGNKIVDVTGGPDLSDPQTAALLQTGQPAVRPPSTGDAGIASATRSDSISR